MTPAVEPAWKVSRIIEDIEMRRRNVIHALLQNLALESYLKEKYHTRPLSAIKTEFLKRDLLQLATAPLDLVHYAAIIRHSKETDMAPDANALQHAIDTELQPVIRKYITTTLTSS